MVALRDISPGINLSGHCVLFDYFFSSGDKNENILIMLLDTYEEYISGIIGRDHFNCLLLDCLTSVMHFENGELTFS